MAAIFMLCLGGYQNSSRGIGLSKLTYLGFKASFNEIEGQMLHIYLGSRHFNPFKMYLANDDSFFSGNAVICQQNNFVKKWICEKIFR